LLVLICAFVVAVCFVVVYLGMLVCF